MFFLAFYTLEFIVKLAMSFGKPNGGVGAKGCCRVFLMLVWRMVRKGGKGWKKGRGGVGGEGGGRGGGGGEGGD